MIETVGSSVDAMSPAELLAELRAVELARGRLDAHEIRVLARFSALRTDPDASTDYAADEIAVELALTPVAAARRLGTAVAMAEQLPDTVRALERGDLDREKATAIVEHTRVLPPDKTAMVEASVLKFAPGRTVRQIRDKLAREILKIDRDGAEARRQAAAEHAFVRLRPCLDGMAELLVYDRAENLRPIYDLLTAAARSAKAAGCRTGIEILRTKALHDLVLGPDRGRVVTEFRVTIPASALAGASRQPAEIHGYGPTTIETLHELADHNTFWRRIVTDPMTGTVLDIGRRRRHTNALGEHVRTRDKTCVFPGCPRPAEDCQIDHTTDHARGGRTTAANLGALCQHHNLMKRETDWQLRQVSPGHFAWTSPTGTTHEVHPEPLTEPDDRDPP
ncbi:HNH endonuclease signature motif containing protein [Actinophytocola sp.]|uniref:HNH endonuclease signature motif containing protein n=1 Tax=Actinophytocola sp. TaxID=1872138 RepID=UPI002ED45C81